MSKKQKKSFILPLFLVLVILLVISSIFLFNHYKSSNPKNQTAQVVYLEGNLKDGLLELEKYNLVQNADFAYYYTRIFRKDFTMLAGNYEIPPYLNLDETLDYISNPENLLKDETVTLTFIEGDWAKHIARKIAQNTSVDYDDLLNYWNDHQVFDQLKEKYPFLSNEAKVRGIKILLEGYLFPDTYEFYKNTDIVTVTEKLLDQTLAIYNRNLGAIKQSGMNFHEILTLASIVQYESGFKEDMNMIAGVFFNRLERGIKLESSVTRCYVIGQEREDDWRKCEYDLDYNDPYDTYQNAGLPPGPILNPGESAIIAVLNPVQTDYLFFVGDLDSKTYFAKTLEEHEHNYCKYVIKTCE